MGGDPRLSTRPLWMESGRIPSIDGLRAIAILFVLFSHLGGKFRGEWSVGHFGVTVFFVISGLLITLLLIRERQQTGKISIVQFYKRRALRILPAYFVFLLAIAVLSAFGKYTIPLTSWIGVLTYTSCFMAVTMAPVLGHTWSLSVEEHFYFLWPLIFRFCGRRSSLGILCGCIAVASLVRWLSFKPIFQGQGWIDPSYSSLSQMSSIAVGCLLAIALAKGFTFPGKVLSAAMLLGLSFAVKPPLQVAIADTCRAAAFGLAMVKVLDLPPTAFAFRILNSAILRWIGVLSYSLYLWQQPLIRQNPMPWLGLPLLVAVAAASYYFVERPFLTLKDRTRPTPNLDSNAVPVG